MKRSDEILEKAFAAGRGLTTSERHELRESYKWEQDEGERDRTKMQDSIKKFDGDVDKLNRPRHRMQGKCMSFVECPIDYKCRNYNPAFLKCVNCPLLETDDVCMKKDIHNERNFEMLIKPGRVDLDEA